jgi:hypothetical protein
MAVTLTIVDNQDGTGGVATVAGSGVSATNTLYRLGFDGTPASRAYTLVGSRTGDGTIAIGVTGHYLFTLTTTGEAGFGVGVHQVLTSPTLSQYERVLDAVVTRIVSVGIARFPVEKVKRVWNPRDEFGTSFRPPLIMVAPIGDEKEVGPLLNTDNIVYPVVVAILEKQDGDNVANISSSLLARQRIGDSLRNQRLPGVPEGENIVVDYKATADYEAFKKNALLSGMILYVNCRKQRGLGAV